MPRDQIYTVFQKAQTFSIIISSSHIIIEVQKILFPHKTQDLVNQTQSEHGSKTFYKPISPYYFILHIRIQFGEIKKCIKHLQSLEKQFLNHNAGRAECKLPALTPEAPAFFNPFFLIMKLPPMKILEDRAKTNPFILSADIPLQEESMASVATSPDAIFVITQQEK